MARARTSSCAKRASSIRPASSRSRRATSTSSGSYPAAVRRRRNSSRLRHLTPKRRSARSLGVPRGRAGPSPPLLRRPAIDRARRGPASPFPLAGRRPSGRAFDVLNGDDFVVIAERRESDGLADLSLDLVGHVGVLHEEHLRVLSPLPQLLPFVGEPCPTLLDQLHGHPHIQQASLLGDPLAIHDVEFRRAERRGAVCLPNLRPHSGSGYLLPLLYARLPPASPADAGMRLSGPGAP